MAMDLYDTNLDKWLQEPKNRLDESSKAEIIKRLINALSYLHSKSWCHMDLNPVNILLRMTFAGVELAIADFGLTTLYSSQPIALDGDREGKAPYNLAPDEHISDKIDIWSLGLIVFYIITSRDNFKGLEDTENIMNLFHTDTLLKFQPIVQQCLQHNHEERVSAADLESEYFDEKRDTQNIPLENHSSSSSAEDSSTYLSCKQRISTDTLSSNFYQSFTDKISLEHDSR
ncbi:serine/threonine-protein kinase 17B-like [Watersipora subatra]|uniref:serine/threonine-protein kinase 17B-like n=1 Tax=Watersipora subatra TaxID=2589382 RepID=UPI00355C3ECD